MNLIFKTWVFTKCETIYVKECKKANVPENDALEVIERLMRYFEKRPLSQHQDINEEFTNFFIKNINFIIQEKVNHAYIINHLQKKIKNVEDFHYDNKSIIIKDKNNKIIKKISLDDLKKKYPILKKYLQ